MSGSIEERLAAARPRAFAVAYRMLGTVSDAEDVVQEALIRLHRVIAKGQRIESDAAYVATVTTRLAIDHLRAVRRQREQYVGDWLPEPLLGEVADTDPAARTEMAESLSLALLTTLESLSPEQRAVFLLREVFGYGYDEIAPIVGKSNDNVRQLAARARRHVAARRPRYEATEEQRRRLAERFFAAAIDGDIAGLETLLAADVVLQGDGGGRVPALAGAIYGRAHVSRTLLAWAGHAVRAGAEVSQTPVNGQPGAVVRDALGGVVSVMSLDIADGLVIGVRAVVNPEKLRHLGTVGDMRGLLSAERDASGRTGASSDGSV
jgi:RNA polymerase sigma factor (sigma-70 family)